MQQKNLKYFLQKNRKNIIFQTCKFYRKILKIFSTQINEFGSA